MCSSRRALVVFLVAVLACTVVRGMCLTELHDFRVVVAESK
jgi:hypothetical protein